MSSVRTLPPIHRSGHDTSASTIVGQSGRRGVFRADIGLSAHESISDWTAPTTATYDVSATTGLTTKTTAANATATMPRRSENLRKQTCTELLLSGHVEAYATLFGLTDTTASAETLRVLQHHLVAAENADRAQNTEAAYDARKCLADFLEQSGERSKAKIIRAQCLALASHTGGSPSRRAEALLLQARAEEIQGDLAAALVSYQALFAAAQELPTDCRVADDPDATWMLEASSSVTRVLAAQAEVMEARGDAAAAIALLDPALALAMQAGLSSVALALRRRLGLLWEDLGDARQVVTLLTPYLDSLEQRDPLHQSMACVALARAHAALGDVPRAVQQLEALVAVAQQQQQHGVLVEAASRLGLLCAQQGLLETAEMWHEHAFAAALPHNSGPAVIDACRVRLGVARAALSMAVFPQLLGRAEAAGQPDLAALFDLFSK